MEGCKIIKSGKQCRKCKVRTDLLQKQHSQWHTQFYHTIWWHDKITW